MTVDNMLFDKRVVERNIQRGKITRAQYEAFLAEQEDCEDRLAKTETRFVRRQEEER